MRQIQLCVLLFVVLSPECFVVFVNRKPPNTQYEISEFRSKQPSAKKGPTHSFGARVIHGIAKGRSRIPDSPESAGFFDATKNTHEKTAAAANKNSVAAIAPPRDLLRESISSLPHNVIPITRAGRGERLFGVMVARLCDRRNS